MNWDIICHTLEAFSPVEKRKISFDRCENLLLYSSGAPDLPGAVYVAASESSETRYRHALIISLGGEFPYADNMIKLAGGDLAEVFNALAKTGQCIDALSAELALCSSDQEIVDCASLRTGMPMFYLDQSYRIVAITRNLDFHGDPEWVHMTEKGYLSPESTQRMKQAGDLERLAAAKGAVAYDSDIYPFSCIVCNVLVDGVGVSRLNLLSISGGITPLMLRFGEIIALHLSRVITGSSRLVYDSPLQSMLIDLLRGLRLSDELIADRLRSAPQLSGHLLQLFYIDVEGRAEGQVASYYASLLRHLHPDEAILPLVYEQQLILLCYAPCETDFSPLTEMLSDFCTAHHLRCGVSNHFRKVSALRGHCDQAVAALKASSVSGLSFYKDIMLDHMLSHIPTEQIRFLISPDIARLKEANANFSFSLTETLKCYLECNCNLLRCSQQLFLHKNTLLYRLNHIKSIIHSDLGDADERLLLMLSFRLLDRKSE